MKAFKNSISAAIGGAALLAGALLGAAPAQAASGATGQGCTAYQYSSGGYSSCVGLLQRMLNAIQYEGAISYGGYQLDVDDSFGYNTDTNVRRFQSASGLTSDGVVGYYTWNYLCTYAGRGTNNLASASSTQKSGWQAAYDAGCYVNVPASNGGWTSISKY